MHIETYDIEVKINIQIKLPVGAINPDFEIERLLEQMVAAREDETCSIMEIQHKILSTDSLAKQDCEQSSRSDLAGC